MTTYQNGYYLAKLEDISKEIYQIGQKARQDADENTKLRRTSDLVKLFYLTYLTGSRIGEIVKYPPKIRKITKTVQGKEWKIINIEKVNEKHFANFQYQCTFCQEQLTSLKSIRKHINQHKSPTKIKNSYSKIGNREIFTQNFLLDTPTEVLMWDYITENGTEYDLSPIMERINFNPAKVSVYFKRRFKTTLTDGRQTFKKRGISPHQLRHLRVYSLLYNLGYERAYVKKLMGWVSDSMIDHYDYIHRQLSDQEQIKILERRINIYKDENINYDIGKIR